MHTGTFITSVWVHRNAVKTYFFMYACPLTLLNHRLNTIASGGFLICKCLHLEWYQVWRKVAQCF